MRLIRIKYRTLWRAGDCICEPVRKKFSIFHFPKPVDIRIGKTLFVTKPDAVIISRPDEPRWFHFREDTHFSFLHATVEIGALLEKYRIPTGCILYPTEPELLSTAFRNLTMEFLSQEPNTEDMQNLQIHELLIRLSRSLRKEGRSGVDSSLKEKLFNLRLELLSQPERKWSIEELSRRVALSPSRFHVVYRATFGISPGRDLILARIDHAKLLLLEDKSSSLAAIAEKLGYKNQYDFSRQFKHITGIAPGAYRKNNQ